MSLDEAKAIWAGHCRKVVAWRRALYLGLFAIVLFASLAFLIRLSTGNYPLPALLTTSMFPALIFVCFSLGRMQFWEDKANRQSLVVSILDFKP